jgi:hypothetical protein
MNPQTPAPVPAGGERPIAVPEHGGATSPDQLVAPAVEATSQPSQAASASQLTASDVAAAIAQMPATTAQPAASAAPSAAADQDVIEPEWVDQAEKVIEQTSGDPHAQEEAVEALQVDYLAKRYGHQVKQPDQTSE